MKRIKRELKELLTTGIALNIYLLLCFIALGIAIYNILDLIFIF